MEPKAGEGRKEGREEGRVSEGKGKSDSEGLRGGGRKRKRELQRKKNTSLMDPTHSSRCTSLYFIDIATSLHVFYARASRSDKAQLLRTIKLQNLIALTRCLLMPDFSPERFQVYCLFFAIKSGEERAIPYTARLIGQRTSFLSPQHQ